jgi:hypothetical protein
VPVREISEDKGTKPPKKKEKNVPKEKRREYSINLGI